MVTLSQFDDLARIKIFLRNKRFVRVRDLCEELKIERTQWKKVTRILRELDWYKYNGYQWAHPNTRGKL